MVRLTRQVIGQEADDALEKDIQRRGSGALISFAGMVRPDWGPGGRRVSALRYEAYEPMAEAQLRQLAERAKAQWAVDAVHIHHRLGVVQVGQMSVLILVSGQHRDGAYAASRFVIEQLKRDVPIWKQEHYDDGTAAWADSHGCQHADV